MTWVQGTTSVIAVKPMWHVVCAIRGYRMYTRCTVVIDDKADVAFLEDNDKATFAVCPNCIESLKNGMTFS